MCVCVCSAVRNLRWLAEATYTGEALKFSLDKLIKELKNDNRVVLVLTDGRSDTKRDRVPLNTLCGNGIKVSHTPTYTHTFSLHYV